MISFTIYGCRGSSAFDSKDNRRFGGNSSCYSIWCNQGLIILDAGTGLISLDKMHYLPETIFLIFSHYHHDHVEGLGVSSLPYNPGRKIKVYGRNPKNGLEARLNSVNFPVPLAAMRGLESFNEIQPEFHLGDVKVETLIGNHPLNGSVGYKFFIENKKIVYATDMEFSYDIKGNSLDSKIKEDYVRFIYKANLLIADAQFTENEYLSGKPMSVKGWGHSYPEEILDMAKEAKVKRVVLTHHAPKRNDLELAFMHVNAGEHCLENGYRIRFEFARQGKVINFNSH